jgi:hypothetical protein
VAGGADNDDFVFRIELVINSVKKTTIMTAIRTQKLANFVLTYNYSIKIYIFLFLCTASRFTILYYKIKQFCP